MKRLLVFSVVSLLSATSFAARVQVQARSGGDENGAQSIQTGGGDGAHEGGARLEGRAVEVQRTTVQHAQPARQSNGHWWNRNRHAGTGHPGTYNPHVNNVSRTNVINNNRVRVVPSSTHWSGQYHGRPYRYSYYGGRPWYGFYVGPRYYWSHYYNNRWWWYDDQFARWSFWYGGYWWWGAPGGVTYVYVNDNYVPYSPAVVNVAPPMGVAPPVDNGTPSPVTEAPNDLSATSPDGRRMVQVVGPNSEAFLYDTSSGRSVFMRYLAKDVLRVRFDGGTNHKPLGILVDYKTNSDFTLFDENGTPQGGSVVPTSRASAPAVTQPAEVQPPQVTEPPPPAPLPG